MFFRLLKLAGIDVNAKIAELKADLAVKIGRYLRNTFKDRRGGRVPFREHCELIVETLELIGREQYGPA